LEVSERTKADRFSYELKVKYIPKPEQVEERMKDISLWVLELMNMDEDSYRYLRQLLGYSISGKNNQKIFQVWYGASGNNGKSSLAHMITKCLTSRKCGAIDSSVITLCGKKQAGSANSALMDLKELNIGFINEKDDEPFDQEAIKRLASGGFDEISARQLQKTQERFVSPCKLVIICNASPEFNPNETALMSRFHLVPFLKCFTQKDLENKRNDYIDYIQIELLNEFFTWLCEASCDFFSQPNPVFIPSAISNQTKLKVNSDNDTVGAFFRDYCEPDDRKVIKTGEVFDFYTKVCKSKCKLTRNKFYESMDKVLLNTGISRDVPHGVYRGLKLMYMKADSSNLSNSCSSTDSILKTYSTS
jgi:P4 family phage/plasmid primase-like protien